MTPICCGAVTTVAPGLMMPALSRAMASTVSPRIFVWSRLMDVMTHTCGDSTVLVASSVPPIPTSSTCQSSRRSAKAWKAMAVSVSKVVTPSLLSASTDGHTASSVAAKSSSDSGAPFTCTRSRMVCRCGDVYSPTVNPLARRMDATMAEVLPFPLVPVTCTVGVDKWGRPSESSNACIRPRS